MDSQTYDLILMDIQMPEIDGIETLQRLKALGPSGSPDLCLHRPCG